MLQPVPGLLKHALHQLAIAGLSVNVCTSKYSLAVAAAAHHRRRSICIVSMSEEMTAVTVVELYWAVPPDAFHRSASTSFRLHTIAGLHNYFMVSSIPLSLLPLSTFRTQNNFNASGSLVRLPQSSNLLVETTRLKDCLFVGSLRCKCSAPVFGLSRTVLFTTPQSAMSPKILNILSHGGGTPPIPSTYFFSFKQLIPTIRGLTVEVYSVLQRCRIIS
jgi:hypothetical protein